MSKLIHRHTLLKEAIEANIASVTSMDGLANDILTKVVLETIRHYQERLNVGIADSVSDLLDTFKQHIAQVIFDTASGWKIANREATLFPRGCRFCATRGKSTVVVVEQDPQIRSLLFESGMLGEVFLNVGNNAERVSLALPYVVFIGHFTEGILRNLYCGWRKVRLLNLDDPLHIPLLPNIHDSLHVCTNFTTTNQTGVCEQIEAVLSHFWNSRFNNDLSVHWWNKRSIDSRLRTARSWADASVDDSTFILNIDLPLSGDRTVRKIIDLLTLHEEEPDENQFRHRLSEQIDRCVENLSSKILRFFKKTKFDRYQPHDIKELLASVLKDATGEVRELLFVAQHELGKLQKDVGHSVLKPVNRRGEFWRDYSP